MKVIHKHIIPTGTVIYDIKLHKDFKILTLQAFDRTGCLWIEVDLEQPLETHEFRVVGTGWIVPENSNYVGTYIDGPFVWHVYERAA